MAKESLFTADNPARAKWAHLTSSDNQSECRIRFILPTHRACHIINSDIVLNTFPYSIYFWKVGAYCAINCNLSEARLPRNMIHTEFLTHRTITTISSKRCNRSLKYQFFIPTRSRFGFVL